MPTLSTMRRLRGIAEIGEEIDRVGEHRRALLLEQRIGRLPLHAEDVRRPRRAQDLAVVFQRIDERRARQLRHALLVEPSPAVGEQEGREGIERLHAIAARHEARDIARRIVQSLGCGHQRLERRRRRDALRRQHRLVVEQRLHLGRDRDAQQLPVQAVDVEDVRVEISEVPVGSGEFRPDQRLERRIPPRPAKRPRHPMTAG